MQPQRLARQNQLARVDLREIEDVADDGEERLAALLIRWIIARDPRTAACRS
jgi:hypothetical protein